MKDLKFLKIEADGIPPLYVKNAKEGEEAHEVVLHFTSAERNAKKYNAFAATIAKLVLKNAGFKNITVMPAKAKAKAES